MIVSAYRKRVMPGLRFGSRAQRDIDEGTILADVRYRVLPDRQNCIVCGGALEKENGVIPVWAPGGNAGRPERNAFHPACSSDCRREYQKWLD